VEQRLSLVTLGVSDLDRSRAFYEQLGWRRAMREAEGVVFFQLGGMALSLYPIGDLAADACVPPDGSGFPRFALAYNARDRDEVDRVLAQAEAAGATISKHAQDAFWGGYSGYFADPDGFLWEVAWNPGFPIGADGGIRLPD
jgi:catechol 2,3-dioxygenase-like lactoylglutathione lyase family enzyme